MIIIPARLASTRFPQKVLADIGGLPMVVRTAQRVAHLDDVVVAADDAVKRTVSKRCLPQQHIKAEQTESTNVPLF